LKRFLTQYTYMYGVDVFGTVVVRLSVCLSSDVVCSECIVAKRCEIALSDGMGIIDLGLP